MGAATLVAARLLQFTAALVLCGWPLFYLYGLERHGDAPRVTARESFLRRGLLGVAAAALCGVLFWVIAETASVSDAASAGFNPAALWMVLSQTRFGRACLARIALLLLSLVLSVSMPPSRRLWTAQAVLGATVAASFAWTGHGAADRGLSGAVHLGGDLVHLMAAAVWIGALVPLAALAWQSVRSTTPADARALHYGLDRFSSIGVGVVTALVLGGVVNTWFEIGPRTWRATFTTTYGIVLMTKVALFAGMLALAALNRYRAAPALHAALETQNSVEHALRTLRTTLLAETALVLLVLLAVSVLGTLEPPIAAQ